MYPVHVIVCIYSTVVGTVQYSTVLVQLYHSPVVYVGFYVPHVRVVPRAVSAYMYLTLAPPPFMPGRTVIPLRILARKFDWPIHLPHTQELLVSWATRSVVVHPLFSVTTVIMYGTR